MNKVSPVWRSLALVGCLAGFGCAHQVTVAEGIEKLNHLADPVIQKVPFREEEYVAYSGAGTASLTGTIIYFSGQKRTVGSGAIVRLIPATPHTVERMELTRQGSSLFLQAEDARLEKYVRQTSADEKGRFSFDQLPAGEYLVFGFVELSRSGLPGSDAIMVRSPSIFARVTLKAGAKKSVVADNLRR